MPPDLNTLPPSRSPSTPSSPLLTSLRRTSNNQVNTLETTSPSLHATAAINAVRQRTPDPAAATMAPEARRSSFITNLNLQESAVASSPIERHASGSPLMNTADPHHQRAPSLGQIHQQLENEQEAQVNRLLHMIRVQQDQLAALQAEQQPSAATEAENSAAVTESTGDGVRAAAAGVEHSRSPSLSAAQLANRSPLQRPTSMSRQSSRGGGGAGPSGLVPSSSLTSSPSLRPLSSARSHDEWSMGGTRDDSAFYHAETQMLQRENQMLKMRIRDLERQVAELNRPAAAEEAKPAADSSSVPGSAS